MTSGAGLSRLLCEIAISIKPGSASVRGCSATAPHEYDRSWSTADMLALQSLRPADGRADSAAVDACRGSYLATGFFLNSSAASTRLRTCNFCMMLVI